MARTGQDLLSRLADRGEEAIARMGEMPGAGRLLDVANNLRQRVDELQRRLQRMDVLDRRLTALEARVDELEPKRAPARRATTRKSTTPKKTTTAKKSSGGSSSSSSGSSS